MYGPRSFSWYTSCDGTHWEFWDALFQQELIIPLGLDTICSSKLEGIRYTTCKWWWWWWWLKKDFWNVITPDVGGRFSSIVFPKWVGWYILDYPLELTSGLGNWKSNGLECWGPNLVSPGGPFGRFFRKLYRGTKPETLGQFSQQMHGGAHRIFVKFQLLLDS